MKKITAILFLISLFTACLSQKSSIQSVEPIEIITLRENSLDKFDSIQLVNDEIEYGKIVNQINVTRFPGIPFKTIDFINNSVVLINLDVKESKFSFFEAIPKISNQNLLLQLKGQNHSLFDEFPKHIRFIHLIEIPKVKKIERVEIIP